MNIPASILIGLAVTLTTSYATAKNALPRSTPESQGVSSIALLDLTNTLDKEFDGIHSLMIVRNGKVIAEGWWAPYDAKHNHVLYSLSKSFTSTAVGLAAADGKLDIDDRVLDFFPELAPENVSVNLKAMRVRDLLTMTAGHQDEPSPMPDVVSAKSFLAHPVKHQPGSHFKYNTAATFMQSAIVQKVTGKTVLEYLRPRLFEPLGIEHPVWDTNFQGISLGGYGLRLRTADIAKFGLLYLQKGKWNGQQLLPEEWVKLATSKQVSNGSNPKSDWNQGYGFQFWRSRHNTYRGDGAFSQFCIVIPDHDVVVAITSGESDMQAVMNVLWDKLLPALKATELAADPDSNDRLQNRLKRLSVKPADGKSNSPIAKTIMNRRFEFDLNDQNISELVVRPSDEDNDITLTLNWNEQVIKIPAGFRTWEKGRAPYTGHSLITLSDEPIAGTFAWLSEDTLVVKFCYYETPFHTTFTFSFEEDMVTLNTKYNVGFGPTKRLALSGKAETR